MELFSISSIYSTAILGNGFVALDEKSSKLGSFFTIVVTILNHK